jgi:hypothetical protein
MRRCNEPTNKEGLRVESGELRVFLQFKAKVIYE